MCTKMVDKASTMNNNGTSTLTGLIGTVPRAEVGRLRGMDFSRKRKRLLFFNFEDGKWLLLDVPNNSPTMTKPPRWWAYCSGKKKDGKMTGRRSRKMCEIFSVTLRVRNEKGNAVYCWNAWHTVAVVTGTHGEGVGHPEPIAHDGGPKMTTIARKERMMMIQIMQ